MRFIVFSLILFASVVFSGATNAGLIEYTVVLDSSDLFIESFDLVEDPPGVFDADSEIVYVSTDLPPFSADFSSDKELTLRIEAPPGQYFQITPPADLIDSGPELFFEVSTLAEGPLETGAMTNLVFENLVGMMPILTGEFQNLDFGDGDFSMEISGVVTEPFNFTAMVATFDVPAGFNAVQVNNENLFAVIIAQAEAVGAAEPPADPGLWVAIVPEPGSLTLLVLGGLACARRHR